MRRRNSRAPSDSVAPTPTPPNNVNMSYPLSAEMKDLFKHPNDKALD